MIEVPPKSDLRWQQFIKNGENCTFSSLATKMMYKRCQMLLKLNPDKPEKFNEAVAIAHEYFTNNKAIAESDLKIALAA